MCGGSLVGAKDGVAEVDELLLPRCGRDLGWIVRDGSDGWRHAASSRRCGGGRSCGSGRREGSGRGERTGGPGQGAGGCPEERDHRRRTVLVRPSQGCVEGERVCECTAFSACKDFAPRPLSVSCHRSLPGGSERSLEENRNQTRPLIPAARIQPCVRLSSSPFAREQPKPINHPETTPSSLGALATATEASRTGESDLARSHPQAESSPSSSRPRTMSRPSLPRVYSSSSTAGQSHSLSQEPTVLRPISAKLTRFAALDSARPADATSFFHLETPPAGRTHAVSSRADRKGASTSARATAWSATCSTQRA